MSDADHYNRLHRMIYGERNHEPRAAARCGSVSPQGNQCRGMAGHLDDSPQGRHYFYAQASPTVTGWEQWPTTSITEGEAP